MIKILSEKSLTNKQLRIFIGFVIVITSLGLFSPILASNDANFYAVVAKHIFFSHDFINLTFNQQDWLDKPHLPFWLTAISYYLFGVNVFAYILPGFLFYLLGGYYLYLLARHLFASKEIGLLTSLIYFTTLHLMLSSIDVRQEAYLLGEIIPAVYYWLLYDESELIERKYLVMGAIFTAAAIMTKGIFVLLIIFSGLIGVWLFTAQLTKLFTRKWLYAFLLVLVFILPELIALYIQFDAHPQKIVFGEQHVSGLRWFFIDSQWGRFTNSGPINTGKASSFGHYFYYMHTLLWAFLPWSLVLIFALINVIKSVRLSKEVPENPRHKTMRISYIYLLATIIPTFILFSLTSFQLDHYTNIIMPFLACLCAEYLFNSITKLSKHVLFFMQVALAYILCALVVILAVITLSGNVFMLVITASVLVVTLFVLLSNNYPATKILVFSVLAIMLVFIFTQGVNSSAYARYDVGYNITQQLKNTDSSVPLVDYQVNSLSLEFLSPHKYQRVADVASLVALAKPYYLVINANNWATVCSGQNKYCASGQVINSFKFVAQDKFIPTLFYSNKLAQNTQNVLLVLIK